MFPCGRDTLPDECGMFPIGRDTLPDERGTFPIGRDTSPSRRDTLSDECGMFPIGRDTMFPGGRDKSGPYSFRNQLRVDDTLPETGGRDNHRVIG